MDTEQFDLNSVLEMFAQTNRNQVEAVANVDTAQSNLNTSVETEMDSIIREAGLAGDAKKLEGQIILNRAKRNQEAAAFYGVNQQAANSIIAEMSASIQQQHGDIQASGRKILAKQKQTFSDDPVAWLYNQFSLQGDVAAHNTALSIMDQDIEVLSKLGELADRQVARNNAIDANTSTDLLNTEAERLLASARVRAEDARQKAIAQGVQFGTIRTATNQATFANIVQVHNAQLAVEHLTLARMTAERQKEQSELQRKQLELMIQDRTEKLEARAALQTNLDKATGITGMRRINAMEWDHLPESLKRTLFEVMSDPNIMEGRLGRDSLGALENAENLNAPLTPGVNEVKNTVQRWAADIRKKPELLAMKPAEKHSTIEKYIKERTDQEINNIRDGDGLYSAPSIAAVDKIPVIKSTKLWTETFAPQAIANKNIPLRAQAVYDAAVDSVTQNRMTLDQAAAEVALIYKAITIDNSQQRDYNRFALPRQSSYRTSLDLQSGIFRGTEIIDLSNPAQVNRALTRTVMQQKMNNQPQPVPFMTPRGNTGEQN